MTDTVVHIAHPVAPRSSDGRPSLTRPVGGLTRLLVLFFVGGLVVVPLLLTALGGFKTLGELRTNLGLPHEWQWQNYWGILSSWRYWQVLLNSLFISCTTVVLTLAVAAPAAFAFAHMRFFGERFLFNYLILGLTFPFATAILPLFITVRDLGLLDTHWGVILPQVAFGQALSILLLRNSFRQLPHELLESALVDGCGYMRFFLWITLPLSRPILATVAVITFVASWNNFLLPLVMLDSDAKYPWPLGLMSYQGQYMTSWQLVLAFVTLTVIPAVAMFVAAQRQIVAGLTSGAVKG